MAEAWSAEEHVDEQRARQLIRTRFEEPVADEVQLVSEGWDYAVFRVDGVWAFRFPRREVVVTGTRFKTPNASSPAPNTSSSDATVMSRRK